MHWSHGKDLKAEALWVEVARYKSSNSKLSNNDDDDKIN